MQDVKHSPLKYFFVFIEEINFDTNKCTDVLPIFIDFVATVYLYVYGNIAKILT